MARSVLLLGVAGVEPDVVENALASFFASRDASMKRLSRGKQDGAHLVLYSTEDRRTLIRCPDGQMDDQAAAYLSTALATPVLAFQVFGRKLWVYHLYAYGHAIDAFTPVLNAPGMDMDDVLLQPTSNAAVIACYWPAVQEARIKRYFLPWSDDTKGKAYFDDTHGYRDARQVGEVMRKLGLPAGAIDELALPDDEDVETRVFSLRGWEPVAKPRETAAKPAATRRKTATKPAPAKKSAKKAAKKTAKKAEKKAAKKAGKKTAKKAVKKTAKKTSARKKAAAKKSAKKKKAVKKTAKKTSAKKKAPTKKTAKKKAPTKKTAKKRATTKKTAKKRATTKKTAKKKALTKKTAKKKAASRKTAKAGKKTARKTAKSRGTRKR